jgi:hypothetical protein
MRCELVPLPQTYLGNFWTKAPPTPPPLVLDTGMNGAIRVTDANTNALIASAPLAQVTATPARYTSEGWGARTAYRSPSDRRRSGSATPEDQAQPDEVRNAIYRGRLSV